MFDAVDSNYHMPMQYKYAWNSLKKFGQLRDERIWKNLEYLIDWMEENFTKDKFFEIMGKSYNLDNSILYRVETSNKNRANPEGKTLETWLMKDIIRYVENPEYHKKPTKKYIGKIRFRKVSQNMIPANTDPLVSHPMS